MYFEAAKPRAYAEGGVGFRIRVWGFEFTVGAGEEKSLLITDPTVPPLDRASTLIGILFALRDTGIC